MMNIKELILSFLFTKRCRFCQNVCDIRNEICDNCTENLPEIKEKICFKCGIEASLCECKGKARFFSSVCAPYYYEGGPKRATIILKYQPIQQILQGLSADMAHCVRERYKDYAFDCIAYVPIYEKDMEKRGFNQAELLAKGLSENLNIPVYNLLLKTFETEPQHALPEMRRSGNLLGAIEFNEASGININDMRILLCDDIKTTGSTLDECAKTLLINGCAEVRCIAACIRKPKEMKKDF